MNLVERTCLKLILVGVCLILVACGDGPDSSSQDGSLTTADTQPPVVVPPAVPPTTPALREIQVSDVTQLRNAVGSALAGDAIILNNGIYSFTSKLNFNRAGTSANPIVVRAKNAGQVTIKSNTVELFNVSSSDWRFENLIFEGVCSNHSDCEHAFHIVGSAHRTVIKNSILREFNAMIKGNGESGTYPDDVLIEGNSFYNSTGRNTSNPVTYIDVVGGGRWKIRSNKISDFFKNGGNGVSYAAFLKGNSYDGLFENNLVICSKNHSGGTRIGLSFGGGGTDPNLCQLGSPCANEHRNGTLRNNIIMNCNDVGIYLNKAQGTKIYNNTLYNTNGIDVRYSTSTADIRNNIISSNIRNRDGGTHTASSNLTGQTVTQLDALFAHPSIANFALKSSGSSIVDKGVNLVTKDLCDLVRTATSDIGAIEYASGTACPNQIQSSY